MWREELYGKFLHLPFDSAVNFKWLLRNKALIKTQTLILKLMHLYPYPNKLKISVHKKTCIQIFKATLFTTAKTWEQLKYPLVG